MNKFRDFIYNVSDILVTLLIIIAALLLITWRVSAIMQYGSSDVTDISAQTEQAANSASADSGDDSAASDSGEKESKAAASVSSDVSFTVSPNQSAESIGQALADAGLVSDKQAFLSAVDAAGAATRLKIGSFTIPAGSTPEQIVVILTS